MRWRYQAAEGDVVDAGKASCSRSAPSENVGTARSPNRFSPPSNESSSMPRAWPTREGLRRTVFEYIEGWCNTRRLHSTLGYLSPAQCETIHHNADRQAA